MLRKSGASWPTICDETGPSKGTAQRALHSLSKKIGEHCGQIVNSVGNPSDILRHFGLMAVRQL